MSNINPLKAAENLERLAKDFEEVGTPGNAKVLRYFASVLRRVASGELAEVVHAHWVIKGTHAICSKCKEMSYDAYEGDCDYCPSCGALMDGKDDSHETD